MREILFRGKRVDNGEWVYGTPIYDGKIVYILSGVIEANEEYICIEVWNPVIPETVGQYTGLDDKNGQRIFEGDVVECISTWDKANMVVIFEDGEYRLVLCDKYKNYTPGSGYYSIGCFDKKVIGNIHDNPEMMEAQNDH